MKKSAIHAPTVKRAVILFTRVPQPGTTKTRMMPYLTPEECAQLHIAFLKDIIREAAGVSADLRVYATPEPNEPSFRALFPEGTAFFCQEGNDLGARMERALTETLEAGYSSAVLVGTDLPELRTEDLRCAFRVLEQRDVVLGPTRDGGYWLIGLNAPSHAPFEPKTYGDGSVYAATVAGIEAAGLSVGTVRELDDMDEREDLDAFRSRLRLDPVLRKTESGRYVLDHTKISVIVPSYNEESTLPALLRQLDAYRRPGAPYAGQLEFLFSDGGSTDRTVELLNAGGWNVLSVAKGRANQMNAAAEQATGDILFFLHCDSVLPEDFPREILDVMAAHEAGCFGITYVEKDAALHINALYANHVRMRLQKIMFGDQGIFLTRELFFRVGGYPPLPLMEDLQLSMTLRDMGVTPGLAKHRIGTSPRRHPKKSFIKQMISLHQYPELRKMYRDGVPIEEIAKRYKDIR